MSKKTAIVLINFNGLADTTECLNSLQRADGKFKIYIANYQDKKQEAELKKHSLSPTIYTFDKNLGFAGFNNAMTIQAFDEGATEVVLLNNDTVVAKDFLKPLIAQARKGKSGLVSPKIYFYKGQESYPYPKQDLGKVLWYAGGVIDWRNMITLHRGVDELDRGHFDKLEQIDFATGCCTAFSKETWDAIGPMPKNYFMYYEDVMWSLTAKHNDLKVIYQPKSIIWHKNAGSSGGSGSSFHQYYQTRNRLAIGLALAPFRTKVSLLKEALNVLTKGSSIQKRAIVDGFLGRLGRNRKVMMS